jgi:ABC-type Fe3+/spermidine/putrescine transport system ATPase subunit
VTNRPEQRAGISLNSKVFDDETAAVDDVQLTIGAEEFMVLVRPSSCGETTLLRMIAGLEEVTPCRRLHRERPGAVEMIRGIDRA